MKRIDQKVQEIEKKDKQNRIIYIAFVVLILAFMASILYYQDVIAKKDQEITEEQVKNSQLYKDLEEKKNTIEKQKNELEASLNPTEYWNEIKKQNSVEGYISYLTNKWAIEKPESAIQEAHAKLQSENDVIGYKGWLFCGAKTNDGTYTTRDIIEVVYREGAEGDFADTEPKVGDIIRLKETRNRRTYPRNGERGRNEQGFRNKTRAYVAKVWDDPNTTNFEIFIKYY